MKGMRKYFLIFVLLLLAATGCLPQQAQVDQATQAAPQNTSTLALMIDPTEPKKIMTAVPVDDPSRPESVALMFYRAYKEAEGKRIPTIGSQAFTARFYLSKDYLTQLAEIEAGFEGDGYNAVWQTQMVPPEPIEVKAFNIDGNQSSVILRFGRGVIEPPYERTVSLEKIDGNWRIVPDRAKDGGKSPEETVKAFYNWYLAYIGSGAQQRNPLADRAYQTAPYLERGLIDQVDRQLEAKEGLVYDPFLCAQDIPSQITVSASFYNAARPVVVAQSSFPGHFLVIDLARENFNRWVIRRVTCGSTPEGTAKAFYTWLLGYMDPNGEMHNPWVDGAYRSSPFLSQTFIKKIDKMMASENSLRSDPALLAQAHPQAFNVERCPEDGCARVNLQFGDATIHQVRVKLQVEDNQLKIVNIQPAPELDSPEPTQPLAGIEKWALFRDEQYGYALRFPLEWRVYGLKVTDSHTPQQYSGMRSIRFTSPELDGTIIPIELTVQIGDEATIKNERGFSEPVKKTTVKGYPVTVYRSEPGISFYVFQHPSRPGTWVILTDYVSQFSGREEMAKQVAGVSERMVSTITFSK